MVGATLRGILRRLGLTGPARRVVLWLSGSERRIALDDAEAVFEQRDFGDYVELNQVGPERPVLERLRSAVRPDDVFLDVGSNLGTFAVFVGDALDDGEVVAVEPVPETAEKLAANLERNGVAGTVCRVAFSDEPGTAEMTVPDAHGSAALHADADEGSVTVVRGDEYLVEHDLPSPTVLKVDVEGYEAAALRGLSETLSAEDCRIVVCEVHGESPADERESASAIRSELSERGFHAEVATDLPGHRHVLWAERS